MALQANYFKKIFTFNFKARTSRGLMREKVSWFIKVWDVADPSRFGIGECGPLPGLSIDHVPHFEDVLKDLVKKIETTSAASLSVEKVVPPEFPSIHFGLETALLDLANGGERVIFKNDFVRGRKIPINGLIWMGDMDFMMTQINTKISQGFKCIKLKVGGLDFERECDTLSYIRKRYFKDDITIRLDANGAFKLDDVLFKLTELAPYNVQSIEQPIKPGLPEMEELCRKSPIPIAFDEELIGKHSKQQKQELLKSLNPKFIILKPTLLGGFKQCQEWISIAESMQIGWWITSALESNIGLNAICQFTASFANDLPQGLGTGGIYTNNFTSPLNVSEGHISYQPNGKWDDDELES